jgi:drug/metabolite transporter (DMT)-like permease
MQNLFLYVITVLIWGSTWFAIEFQLGEVAIEVSLVYRFSLAALFILALSKLKGLNLKFTLRQHGYMALLGLLNFSLNYVTLYHAQNYLSSAMTSIGFSLLLLANIINARLFFGKAIAVRSYFGAVLGIGGIVVLFWPEVSNYQSETGTMTGIGLVVAGILFASLGNMVSVRNSNHQLPIFQTSGWGMLYGSLFLFLAALYRGAEFTFSSKPEYLISLGYLTLFGTVIAFYSYFMLLKNIGPEKASYSIVLFPVVAVMISSLYEGFAWNIYTVSGFILVASGNLLVLTPLAKVRAMWQKFHVFRGQASTEPQNCLVPSPLKPS